MAQGLDDVAQDTQSRIAMPNSPNGCASEKSIMITEHRTELKDARYPQEGRKTPFRLSVDISSLKTSPLIYASTKVPCLARPRGLLHLRA
jgi:hypothetical protein